MGPSKGGERRARRKNEFEDVQVELTELLFHRLFVTILLGGSSLIGFTMVMARRYGDPWLWRVWVGMVVICTVRLALAFSFTYQARRRSVPLTVRSARRWEAGFGALTILHSSTMALCTYRNFEHYDFPSKLVCAMGTFAFCNGICARLPLRTWIAKVSGFIMLAALAWGLLHCADPLTRSTVLILIFYFYTYVETIDARLATMVEQFHSRRKLRTLAEQDMLTGLANRRCFESRLATLCGDETSFALLLIDLDRFKAVNDTHGHGCGDMLLRIASARMASALRPTDLLARLGGDEFAILQVPLGDRGAAEGLAARINALVGEPFDLEGNRVEIGASIGIQIAASRATDPEGVVRGADEALYRVKEAGRGSFCLA